ncbi:MAG: hypothetical protein HDR01_13315 [Lachnospiraceae bacterium]|nr:hypothetical protein [Lachnospiraceae bacterium]
MAFREKLEEFAKTACDKTGEAVEYTRLNAKIFSEKNAIKDDYKKLGEYMYQAYKDGAAIDERALDFCHSIDTHNRIIESTQEELNRSKTPQEKTAADDSAANTVIVSQVINTSEDEVEMTAEDA